MWDRQVSLGRCLGLLADGAQTFPTCGFEELYSENDAELLLSYLRYTFTKLLIINVRFSVSSDLAYSLIIPRYDVSRWPSATQLSSGELGCSGRATALSKQYQYCSCS